jgi:hypothetical protein
MAVAVLRGQLEGGSDPRQPWLLQQQDKNGRSEQQTAGYQCTDGWTGTAPCSGSDVHAVGCVCAAQGSEGSSWEEGPPTALVTAATVAETTCGGKRW